MLASLDAYSCHTHKALAVSFLTLTLLSVPHAKAQAQTQPDSVVRGTIQFKRGQPGEMPGALREGQPYMMYRADGTIDLFAGTTGGNKRLTTRFLVASGAPSSVLGGFSDTYLDTTTLNLYLKGSGGWSLKANLTPTNGTNGTNGQDGAVATVMVGTVATTAAGTQPTVTGSGTATNRILNFTFPLPANGTNGTNGVNGTNGAAATVTVGTTTTLASNATPTVANTGTSNAAVFTFGLPAGAGTLIRNVQSVAVPAIGLGALGVTGTGQVTVTFATPFADANFIAHPSFRKTTNGLNVTLSLAAFVRSQTASSVTFDITTANVALTGGTVVMDVTAIHNP